MSAFLDCIRYALSEFEAAHPDLPNLREARLRLDEPQIAAALQRHQNLLRQWNPKLNLSRVVEDKASALKHFSESILCGTLVEESERSILDLGSGAGFPGVPISVVWPSLRLRLLESDVRKAVFLKEVSRGCSNVHVDSVRSDAFLRRNPRPPVDLVISRAVSWKDLSELAIALRVPLIWVTSEAEIARVEQEGFHVARSVKLPSGAGIAIRMFHVERGTEVLR